MVIISYKVLLFRALLIAITLLAAPLATAQQEVWWERGNERIKLFIHPGDETNATGLMEVFDRTIPELETKLGVSIPYQPRIFLVASQEEFDRATGGTLPPWSEGVSFAETGAIVLKSPSFSGDIDGLQRTAVHEFVHLMVAKKAGRGVPRWLNEGLAQFLSGEGQGKALMPLSRALWSNRLLPLTAIERVDRFSKVDAELAYLQSFHATEFLINQYGWETLRDLLSGLGEGMPWEEALFRVIQTDQAGFEATWRAQLEKSYRWMILLDSQIYLFIGATILVLMAGFTVIRRRRRIYRKWEAEDGPQAGIF